MRTWSRAPPLFLSSFSCPRGTTPVSMGNGEKGEKEKTGDLALSDRPWWLFLYGRERRREEGLLERKREERVCVGTVVSLSYPVAATFCLSCAGKKGGGRGREKGRRGPLFCLGDPCTLVSVRNTGREKGRVEKGKIGSIALFFSSPCVIARARPRGRR